MGYCFRENGIVEAERSCHKRHHERRPCEDCFDPLVLMYIDDNRCSVEDEEEAEWDDKWWDEEGAEEFHHRRRHRFNCRDCYYPRVLMYIDDNLCVDDAQVAAEYGWEWCIIEDEFGRRRWHKRRKCCYPRVLMAIDEDPCLLAEAEAARNGNHGHREET